MEEGNRTSDSPGRKSTSIWTKKDKLRQNWKIYEIWLAVQYGTPNINYDELNQARSSLMNSIVLKLADTQQNEVARDNQNERDQILK